MIFEALFAAAERGELILVDGGMCKYHKRLDGQLTIHEIIVLPGRRRQGIGRAMLEQLQRVDGVDNILAKAPVDLEANGWYAAMGFDLVGVETTRSGREVNVWRFPI